MHIGPAPKRRPRQALPSTQQPSAPLLEPPRPDFPDPQAATASAADDSPKKHNSKIHILDAMLADSIASARSNIYRVSEDVYRIAWIDIAKCLAILFIVVAQASSALEGIDEGAKMVFSFASALSFPLLFVMCGYTTQKEDFSARYILTLAHKYLIPYVFAGAIYIALSMGFTEDKNLLEWVATLLYGASSPTGAMLVPDAAAGYSLGLLWVFPTLFLGRLFAYFLSYVPLLTRLIVAGALFIVGSGTSGGLFLPCDLQPSLCALWYMTCGMILREKDIFSTYGWEKILLALCASAGVGYFLMMVFSDLQVPDYALAHYSQSAIDMIGTVCTAMVGMSLAQLLSELGVALERGLEWLGRNLIALLAWTSVFLVFVNSADAMALHAFGAGMPPWVVLLLSTLAMTVLIIFASWVSYKVPALHWVLIVDEKPSKTLLDQGKRNKEILSTVDHVATGTI